jgi:hypothetical protein
MFEELERAHSIHVRPAQIGDVCLLLEPAQEEEIRQLQRHQVILQSLFGGISIEKIHLTCQRFVCRDGLIGELVAGLEDDFRTVAHVAMKATGLETLYVPVRRTSILKWRIEISKSLEDFVATVERRVVATGIQPLYKAGFVSSLVAALRGVAKLEKADCDQYDKLPYHLFTGERVSLSRIEGANKFDTLATIYWGQ